MKIILKKVSATHKYLKEVLILSLIICLLFSGCKKYLAIDAPVSSINAANVYEDDALASAVLTGIYARISGHFTEIGPTTVSLYTELSADNLISTNIANINQNAQLYFQNALTKNIAVTTSNFWTSIYPVIYATNAAIEGLNGSKNLTPLVKTRLLGEAYFLRAYFYFTLVNLYGDVPLFTTSIFQTNVETARTPVTKVYQQIVEDLNQAKDLLDDRYVDATVLKETQDRVRPNRMAALALLARTQLYRKEYAAAEAAASEVIGKSDLYTSNLPLGEIFLKNSKETIWAFQPVKANFNTDEAEIFTLPAGGPDLGHPFYVSNTLKNAFEPGDLRKRLWMDSVTSGGKPYAYPSKYKMIEGSAELTEYTIVLRLAEQYLIRAEARNEQNNSLGSVADLNVLRSRSRGAVTTAITNPLPALPNTLTKVELRDRILRERRVELFTEGGHRWFDLKRLSLIDEVMSVVTPLKGGSWASYKALYPIPLHEILASHVLTQNPGYN
jgi:hypothetical protein